MGSLKSLALLALLLSFSLAVSADTSNEATHATDDVNTSEATDAIEPQQRGGCRHGCCGAFAFGRCSACCSLAQAAEAKTETNDAVVTRAAIDDVKASEATDAIEPQQRGGCRHGCCGAFAFGRCSACCSLAQAAEAKTKTNDVVVTRATTDDVKTTEETDAIEPQQRGGCRHGCCGSFAFGRCSACCSLAQAAETKAKISDVVVTPAVTDDIKASEATDAIEPQQRGGCRHGCCGSFAFGRCSACCSLAQAEAKTKTNDVVVTPAVTDDVKASEATDAIEPQQRGGCRYGCCGSFAFGRCSACCSSSQAAEANTEASDVDVESQKRLIGGCRYGCCGPRRFGRCTYCCKSSQAEAEVVEPQQRRRCRYGCCGSYAFGQCSACCSKKIMATEEEKKAEEAKP